MNVDLKDNIKSAPNDVVASIAILLPDYTMLSFGALTK